MYIFGDFFEQYYLMINHKEIIDAITNNTIIGLCFEILLSNEGLGVIVAEFLIKVSDYYTKSSYNQENLIDPEYAKRNLQRLESQPFIVKLVEMLPLLVDIMAKAKDFTFYHFKILEIIAPTLLLFSRKIFSSIKLLNFFKIILNFFFLFPNNSLLHKKIEKIFRSIF